MTMQDWAQRLNRFLEFNEHEILHDTGRVPHEIAKAFAESEFKNIGSCRIVCLRVILTVSLFWRRKQRSTRRALDLRKLSPVWPALVQDSGDTIAGSGMAHG